MSTKTREYRGSFIAVDDKGNEYRIHKYQDMIESRTLDGAVSRIPGLKELLTDDGDHVNFVEPGVYEIVAFAGPIRVTSDDPAAAT